MDRDEFYQTILGGLASYREDPFILDVRDAVSADPTDVNFAYALNKNQLASKCWLMDELRRAAGSAFGTIYVLGGWYGTLSAMLLQDPRFDIGRAISVDIDPACEQKARSVNRTGESQGRFRAVTGDMLGMNYGPTGISTRDARGVETLVETSPDLVINTSCEHLSRFDAWYGQIPDGLLLALQSNDYFSCDEHVNCMPDLGAFRTQAPMRDLLYAGTLPRKRYSRFMLIGRK